MISDALPIKLGLLSLFRFQIGPCSLECRALLVIVNAAKGTTTTDGHVHGRVELWAAPSRHDGVLVAPLSTYGRVVVPTPGQNAGAVVAICRDCASGVNGQ